MDDFRLRYDEDEIRDRADELERDRRDFDIWLLCLADQTAADLKRPWESAIILRALLRAAAEGARLSHLIAMTGGIEG